MATKYKKFVICEHCNGLGKIEKEFVEEDEEKKGAKAVVDGKDLRFDEKNKEWKEEEKPVVDKMSTTGNEVKEDAKTG